MSAAALGRDWRCRHHALPFGLHRRRRKPMGVTCSEGRLGGQRERLQPDRSDVELRRQASILLLCADAPGLIACQARRAPMPHGVVQADLGARLRPAVRASWRRPDEPA